jgi:hypothetical protein
VSDELRDITPAKVLAAHQQRFDPRASFWEVSCTCGEWKAEANDLHASKVQLHAEHQLAALKASGYEVVKLPEPMCPGRPEIAAGNGAITSHDGHDVLIAFPGEAHRWRSPRMARVLAGSILASAADADGA